MFVLVCFGLFWLALAALAALAACAFRSIAIQVLPYVGSFFALVAHFLAFLTVLRYFVFLFRLFLFLEAIFRGLGRIWGGIFDDFAMFFRTIFENCDIAKNSVSLRQER